MSHLLTIISTKCTFWRFLHQPFLLMICTMFKMQVCEKIYFNCFRFQWIPNPITRRRRWCLAVALDSGFTQLDIGSRYISAEQSISTVSSSRKSKSYLVESKSNPMESKSNPMESKSNDKKMSSVSRCFIAEWLWTYTLQRNFCNIKVSVIAFKTSL